MFIGSFSKGHRSEKVGHIGQSLVLLFMKLSPMHVLLQPQPRSDPLKF
jgi:hypothetical protein